MMGQRGATPRRIVAATHNPGKVRELRDLLEPLGYDPVSAGELGLAEPEETETTFEGNAELKARASCQGSGMLSLADDSGLEVDCLGGDPGVYSARWAGPDKDFRRAMEAVRTRIMEAGVRMEDGPQARFVCVLALAWPDGRVESFRGSIEGRLVWPPRGDRGFGYDPFFVPDGLSETFGEMAPEAKHAISHRAVAFALLRERLGVEG
jgi:XTP/dITP diphosphohydrolase